MKLKHIEHLRYDLIEDNSVNWELLDQTNIDPHNLRKLIDEFLFNLKPDHQMSGSDYFKLQGIGYWIKEHNHYTNKQKSFALLAILAYWEELDYFKIYN